MSTILLTGANGFVGAALSRLLLQDGFKVMALKRTHSDLSSLQEHSENIEWYDINNGLEVPFNNHKNIKAIVHLATNYGRAGQSINDVYCANLNLPMRLLDLAVKNGIDHFISTDTFSSRPEYNYNYLKPYHASKRACLEAGKLFSEMNNLTYLNMRLEHVFGPLDQQDKFVMTVLQKLRNNQPTIEFTSALQKRDFIFVEDVVSAYLTVIKKNLSPGFYNIGVGRGESTSLKSFIQLLKQKTLSTSDLKFGALNQREGEIMDSFADISTLKTYGWKPAYTIEHGIEKLIKS